jgi:type IV secretion system protein VirB9
VFEIVTTAMPQLDPAEPDLYYSVQFTYPDDDAAARRQEAAQRAAAQSIENKLREERLTHQVMEARTRNPLIGPRNWHYIAQGDRSLLPLEVFDNGYSTVFRFPGNVRIPSVYVLDPDGKEATANYAVKGDLVEVSSVQRGWRLRDGQTVLCIWNRAFDPVGEVPGTGTVSPDVQRMIKEPPP